MNAVCKISATDEAYSSMGTYLSDDGASYSATGSHSRTLTGLTNQSYQYYVRCANQSAVMTGSTQVGFTVSASSTAASAPRAYNHVLTVGSGSVDFSLDTNVSSTGTFRVYSVADGGTAVASASMASGTSHSGTVSGLTNGSTYYYDVTLTDLSGNTVTSGRGSFVLDTAGSDIVSLSPQYVMSTQFTISNTVESGADSRQYRVSEYPGAGSWNDITNDNTYVSSLSPDTTYYYQVRVVKGGHTTLSIPLAVKLAPSSPVIAVRSISKVDHGTVVAGGTYSNGYHLRFLVSVNSWNYDSVKFKLGDWSNGVTTLVSSWNTVMYVSSNGASDYASVSGSVVPVTTSYDQMPSISSFDADPTLWGRQIAVDVFYKVPADAKGRFSTSFGILAVVNPT